LKNGTHLDSELNVEASAPSATQTTRKFELIVGCFSSKLNATNLISSLRNKGFSAKIYDEKNGLQRITVGSADVESNLQVLKEKITALGIEAWVLKN
jgi:cell division septation protein DedD